MSDYGTPLHPNSRCCVRCNMPETAEGMQFDEMGICRACQSQEKKCILIGWSGTKAFEEF